MAYQRKYRKGAPICSMEELVQQEYIYHAHKILHRGWFLSWQIGFAQRMIERRVLYRAEIINTSER